MVGIRPHNSPVLTRKESVNPLVLPRRRPSISSMRRLRLDPLAPRLLGTVALLGLALVVASGLAYQAWRAARSQETTADRTLRDYAAFADWQLAQQARGTL